MTGITNYKRRMIQDTEWQTREPITSAMKTWQSLQQSMVIDAQDEVQEDKNGFSQIYKAHLEPQRIRAFKITYKH